MDVRELIKWLCQVKKPNIKTGHVFENCSKTSALVFFVYALVSSFPPCQCQSDSYESASFSNNKDILSGVSALSVKNDTPARFYDGKSDLDTNFGLRQIFDSGFKYLSADFAGHFETESARTFGRPIKKLQAMMIPLMFKLGILSTLIVMTFLLALKAVVIGKILLMLKMATLLGKLFTLKDHGHGQGDWSPQKQVHVHLHNSPSTGHGISSYAPYGNAYGSDIDAHSSWGRRDPVQLASNIGPGVINTPYGHYVRTGGPTGSGYLNQ